MIKDYRAELEREFAWRNRTQVNHEREGSNGEAS
jgi:hypothetical protein